MVGIHSCQGIDVSQVFRQPFRHELEEGIADGAAETVVDLFEPLQVKDQQRHFSAITCGTTHVLGEAIKKEASIRKSRQLMVVGEMVEPLLFLEVVDRERHIVCKPREELKPVGVEELPLVRI